MHAATSITVSNRFAWSTTVRYLPPLDNSGDWYSELGAVIANTAPLQLAPPGVSVVTVVGSAESAYLHTNSCAARVNAITAVPLSASDAQAYSL